MTKLSLEREIMSVERGAILLAKLERGVWPLIQKEREREGIHVTPLGGGALAWLS